MTMSSTRPDELGHLDKSLCAWVVVVTPIAIQIDGDVGSNDLVKSSKLFFLGSRQNRLVSAAREINQTC